MRDMIWIKKEGRLFKKLLEESVETYNAESSLIITEGSINCELGKQTVMHFINPRLATLPRGFAKVVAETRRL